jgi:hypothetical protein
VLPEERHRPPDDGCRAAAPPHRTRPGQYGGKPDHCADELGHESRGRALVKLVGARDLLEASGSQHPHPVGDRERLRLVVCDEDCRDAEFELDAPDLLAQLHAHLGIECRQGLVQEQHLGETAKAGARATRCCCPPESWCGYRSPRSARPTNSSSSPARPARSDLARRRTRRPKATFSATVRFGKRLYAWKTIPMSRLLAGVSVSRGRRAAPGPHGPAVRGAGTGGGCGRARGPTSVGRRVRPSPWRWYSAGHHRAPALRDHLLSGGLLLLGRDSNDRPGLGQRCQHGGLHGARGLHQGQQDGPHPAP